MRASQITIGIRRILLDPLQDLAGSVGLVGLPGDPDASHAARQHHVVMTALNSQHCHMGVELRQTFHQVHGVALGDVRLLPSCRNRSTVSK